MYTIKNQLFHPHAGGPPKRDSCTTIDDGSVVTDNEVKRCQKNFGSKNVDERMTSGRLKKRLFSCKDDDCRVKFESEKWNMKRPMDTVHLMKRLFNCSHCSKDFGQREHLFTHIKLVHQRIVQ